MSALTPGGSSGGSAAAVAAAIAPGATGTDTGGSIRQPAAFTGICGIKPTYGRCSRWGIVAFASSLDQAGPMAKSVRDCAILLEAMASFDPKDSTSLDLPVPRWEANLTSDLTGKRVGIPKEYRIDGVPGEIDALWDRGIEWLKDAGATPVEISLPHTKYALPTYYIIAPAEASSNLARYDGVRYGLRVEGVKTLDDMYAATRAEGFGAEVKRRIMIGTYVLSAGFYDAYFTKAQRVRALIKQDFRKAFESCDVILTPTAPSAAFGIGETTDPLAMYLNDVFAVPASLAGLPAMSVPGGLDEQGLPLGLHLIGNELDEQVVLNAGVAIEERAGFTAGRRSGGEQGFDHSDWNPCGRDGLGPDQLVWATKGHSGGAVRQQERERDQVTDFRIKGETGEWEVVVGLEVHAQITATASKLFSGAATAFGAEPNTQVCLVDAAMPGMLPVPNRECIRQAVRTGMALDAQINRWSRFDRKNYFYADLPQGYQISQLYHPLVGEGEVEILTDEKDETRAKRIGIERHPRRAGRGQADARPAPDDELRRFEPLRRRADGDRVAARHALARRSRGLSAQAARDPALRRLVRRQYGGRLDARRRQRQRAQAGR